MSKKRHHSTHYRRPGEKPLWSERVARIPILPGLMVLVAQYRRRVFGLDSTAPVPELFSPDPLETRVDDPD
jgi:hypothetical protein